MSTYIDAIIDIATAAGEVALGYYDDGPGDVEYKADNSPLTRADRESHNCIVQALGELTPEIPVLSEESNEIPVGERRDWQRFWLVDPLDGSKEFIKKTGEFTVNIALVDDGEPVVGVVRVPVTRRTYWGAKDDGAFVRRDGEGVTAISTRRASRDSLTVVASRDHAGPEVQAFLKRLANGDSDVDVASMGSSLKFCLVAEGKADLYPRLVPTMEWDTGAAQCIVEAAGGAVTDMGGARLEYNKESLRNPSLLAYGDRDVDWVRLFSSDNPMQLLQSTSG